MMNAERCSAIPGKMSDPQFFCDDQGWVNPGADSGGVHINSGVPNHAFALMVDGGSFNGRNITGIGLQKAATDLVPRPERVPDIGLQLHRRL